MFKYVFGFAEHQENATYGLGYNLTLSRNKDEPFWKKLRVLLMLDIKLTISTFMYPNISPL